MEAALKEENVVAMHNACRRGDVDEIRRLLKEGVPVDARDKDLNTPLLSCLKSFETIRKLPVVRFLVENKAMLDTPDKNFLTPLLASVIYGTDEIQPIVEYLLDQKADPQICNNHNQNILHVATIHLNAEQYHELVVLVVKHGYTKLLFAANNFNATPFFEATRIPLLDATLEIFANHWNSSKIDHNAVAAEILNQAVKNLRNGEFLVKLDKVFAGCNALDTYHAMLLDTAVNSGNVSVITLFKSYKAAGDPTRKSPTESASGEDSKRSKSSETNWTKEMALAVTEGNSAIKLAKIFKLEEKFSAEGRFGNTLLHAATYYDNLEVAQLLLENGRDVNFVGAYGFTPIVSGLENNNAPRLDMVKLLVKYGAQVHNGDVKKSAIARCVMRKGPDWIEVFQYLYGIWQMNKGDVEEDSKELVKRVMDNDQEAYFTLKERMYEIGQWKNTEHI